MMSMFGNDETASAFVDNDDSLATTSKRSILGYTPGQFRKPFIASNLVFDKLDETSFGGSSRFSSNILKKGSSTSSAAHVSETTAVDLDWMSSLKDLSEEQEEEQLLEKEELDVLRKVQQDNQEPADYTPFKDVDTRLRDTIEGVSERPQISQTPTELKSQISPNKGSPGPYFRDMNELEEEVNMLGIASGPNKQHDEPSPQKHISNRGVLSDISNSSVGSVFSGRSQKNKAQGQGAQSQEPSPSVHTARLRAPSYASFGNTADINTRHELEHLKNLLAQTADGKKLLEKHSLKMRSRSASVVSNDSTKSLYEDSKSIAASEFDSPSPAGSVNSLTKKGPRTPSLSMSSKVAAGDVTAIEENGTFASLNDFDHSLGPNSDSQNDNSSSSETIIEEAAYTYSKELYDKLSMAEIDKLTAVEARNHLKRITECFRRPFPDLVDKLPALSLFLLKPDPYHEFGSRIHQELYGHPLPGSSYLNPNQVCLDKMADQVSHCIFIASSLADQINGA